MPKKINPKKYLVMSCEELERLKVFLEKDADKLSPYKKDAIEWRIAVLVGRIEDLKKEIENE